MTETPPNDAAVHEFRADGFTAVRGPYRVDLPLTGADFAARLLRHWPDLAWSRRVTVPLRAGDATFHQSRTVHEAGGNRTEEIRLGFIVTFTDAAAGRAGWRRRLAPVGGGRRAV